MKVSACAIGVLFLATASFSVDSPTFVHNSRPNSHGGTRAFHSPHGDSRAVSSIFGGIDPMGMWKSASRMMKKGVHAFRESLQEGIKVAHMFKDDVTEGVSQIIPNPHSESKSKRPQSQDLTAEGAAGAQSEPQADAMNLQQALREGMIGGLLRFMKVDSNQLGIMALNILIFVAEMISQSLLGKGSNYLPESKEVRASVLQWLITGQSSKVENLLKDAKSQALPESIIESLKGQTGNSTSCVQLLICKMSPLIWGVQKTLQKKNIMATSRSASSSSSILDPAVLNELYKAMPSTQGFIKYGDSCEQRFPTCNLLKYPNSKNLTETGSQSASRS